MRQRFVQEATLELTPGADERAPGAAVTMELCGHWEHEGVCQWPHNTAVGHRSGQSVQVRTVFACESDEEERVRHRIVHALRRGELHGPGGLSTWRVSGESAAAPNAADELDDQE